MSQTSIPPALRREVAAKSLYQCSYCLTPERVVGALFTVDHIVPELLGGATTLDNLCLACWDRRFDSYRPGDSQRLEA
ncbi:MAG: HNH endonuclease signature motif containing protein [Chloroflexota bacterium]